MVGVIRAWVPVALLGSLVAGVVGVVALASNGGGASRESRSAAASLSDAEIRLRSEGRRRVRGPESFCAKPNGEPIALACGGRMLPPRGRPLPVRPDQPITAVFGTKVEKISVSAMRATRDGRVVALTHATPLRRSGKGRHWRIPVPHGAPRRGAVLSVAVEYEEGVRLRLTRNRLSRPFRDASATFLVPLQMLPSP